MEQNPEFGLAVAIRSPRDNGKGGIDCEIDHPVYGWIPFTSSPEDPSQHGRQIHERASAMRPAAYVPPPLPTVAETDARADAKADARFADVAEIAEALGITRPEAAIRASLRLIERRKSK